MSAFSAALAQHGDLDPKGRTWFFVPYDQLSSDFGPWSGKRVETRQIGLVLIESPQKAARRPYHKQKLALVLANLRHFAIEQAARGIAVRHAVTKVSYADTLLDLSKELGVISVMEPAERELRKELEPLVARGVVRVIPHEGWITTQEDFRASQKGPPWRMDLFYRHVRRRTGLLMEAGKPEGGRFSFDSENRKRWSGTPAAPDVLTFVPDAITREVGDLISRHYADHPGTLRLDRLPATRADAVRSWSWARAECLPTFGPFEDAMSTRSRRLFHSGLSPLINLGRLSPRTIVGEAAGLDAPLASREGFVRQILGWREYMHHVHVETDGFREKHDVFRQADSKTGGASPSYLARNHTIDVPPAYWDYGQPSNLRCLDEVVRSVWDEAYSHHITRLMVLSNLAMLLDVSPRDLTDWFWVAYADAYDWVVEPNVLAMGTFGTGDLITTKPYVAGSAYIDKMSDYCKGCVFDPKTTCPFPRLYWDFLHRHGDALEKNPRMKLPVVAAAKRPASDKTRDHATFLDVRARLAKGEALRPSAKQGKLPL